MLMLEQPGGQEILAHIRGTGGLPTRVFKLRKRNDGFNWGEWSSSENAV